jgi:hypothetical protein
MNFAYDGPQSEFKIMVLKFNMAARANDAIWIYTAKKTRGSPEHALLSLLLTINLLFNDVHCGFFYFYQILTGLIKLEITSIRLVVSGNIF